MAQPDTFAERLKNISSFDIKSSTNWPDSIIEEWNNIVDLLSESGPEPQRESNANGEFVRFSDGTQICTSFINFGVTSCRDMDGSLFRTDPLNLGNMPSQFISTPKVFREFNGPNLGLLSHSTFPVSDISYGGIRIFRATPIDLNPFSIHCFAIGRWF